MSVIVSESNGLSREIRTRVKVSPSLRAKGAAATFARGMAMWDTGSTNSVIGVDIARKLGLVPIGMTTALTANGPYDTPIYAVDLSLPNNVVVKNVIVSESDLQVCDALIGMDIITLGDMLLTNAPNTRFEFRLPSKGAPPLE